MNGTDGTVRKRSVLIAGHPTSISLESAFWDALKAIARRRGTSVAALIAGIDREREGNLSSAVRVFVLKDYRERLGEGKAVREPGSDA